jgi:hypothetical protein
MRVEPPTAAPITRQASVLLVQPVPHFWEGLDRPHWPVARCAWRRSPHFRRHVPCARGYASRFGTGPAGISEMVRRACRAGWMGKFMWHDHHAAAWGSVWMTHAEAVTQRAAMDNATQSALAGGGADFGGFGGAASPLSGVGSSIARGPSELGGAAARAFNELTPEVKGAVAAMTGTATFSGTVHLSAEGLGELIGRAVAQGVARATSGGAPGEGARFKRRRNFATSERDQYPSNERLLGSPFEGNF